MEFEEYKIMYEAEDRHWWYRGLRSVMFSLLRLHKKPGRSLRILDAGCGTGGNLNALINAGFPDVAGFDYSEDALYFCKLRGLRDVRQGSALDIPFESGSFDVVISCDVLNDEGVHDEKKFLRELHRVLKPGGKLFLNLPAFDFLRGEHDRATSVARRYTASKIRGMLLEAGFIPRRLCYWNMFLLPVVFVVRRVRGRGKNPEEAARSDILVPPAPVNVALNGVVRLEALIARRFDLPFGSSLGVVALKPRRRGAAEA